MTKLTASGYFDESPRWALDGNAVVFGSERYGMRNHASWGSQGDVMTYSSTATPTTATAFHPEDYELLKAESQQEKGEQGKDRQRCCKDHHNRPRR